jgi:NitT/TauT family transport system substrate-binding protein
MISSVIELHAEIQQLVIARGIGTPLLLAIIVEHEKLIERQAKLLELGDLKVTWKVIPDGGLVNSGLISGEIQVAMSGIGASHRFGLEAKAPSRLKR